MTRIKHAYLKHVAFWILFWVVQSFLWEGIDGFEFFIIKNIPIVLYQAGIVYVNWYILIPKLLIPNKYISYVCSAILLIYMVYNVSFAGIDLVLTYAFPDMSSVNMPKGLFWWPTKFWNIISGSAPYSIVLLSSTVVYFVMNSREVKTETNKTIVEDDEPESLLREEDHMLVLKEGKVIHRLDVRDVLYVKGMKEYVSWHTKEKKLMTLHSLTSLESLLKDKGFLRTHRSYIVNINCVQTIEYNTVKIPGKDIPIGRSYKSKVLDRFQSRI